MKPLLNSLTLIIILFTCLLSCKKNATIPGSLIGKWNIQIDSTYSGGGFANHLVIYYGKPGDYFYFNTDGHLYSSENSISDTLIYTISSDSVMVSNFPVGGEVGKCQIPSSATHSLIIRSDYLITPGGNFGRIVYLTR